MSASRSCSLISPASIVDEVRERLAELPDVRQEYVETARASITLGLPSPGAIAARMVASAIEERRCRRLG